jgi:outer membrane protein OmpA-like peptidoglycan-associated protein
MTARIPHRACWLALVGCCTTLAASCSLFRTPGPPNSTTGQHAAAPAQLAPQLAQLDFGRDAVFAQCVPAACPTRTPKTLAHEAPRQPIDPAALRAPAEPVAPAPVPTAPATKAELSRTVTVQFAPGTAKLRPAARSQLNAAVGDLLRVRHITIIGRTDNRGPMAFNQELALARALAVREHLRKTHPPLAATLTLRARGACCFIAPNNTLAGRAQNRRVEVVFRMNGEDQP